MRNYLIIVLIFLSFKSIGQKKVYISGYTIPGYQGALFLADVESCTVDFVGLTDEILNDIAINPINNDMYGVRDGSIFRVDKATADLTLIADSSIAWRSLTFSSHGTLFATDGGSVVYEIDTTDGSYELLGNTPANGGNDLTFYNCLLTYITIYPNLSIIQTDPYSFANPSETFYSNGPLFSGVSTLGCPPSVYGFSTMNAVWRFSDDLTTTELICDDLLPGDYRMSGAAAVYDLTNCEFGSKEPIEVPNVFTPNSDNINDVFTPIESCDFGTYNLQILNRWGSVVFETEFRDQGWDGKIQGENAQEGTYFWVLKLTAGPEVTETTHGVLQLIR